MNRKQKLIISITGITIVMLALLGLTYGYYLTRIQGNTNTNSISITTSDLKLTYRDGTGELIANNIMPGDEITSKTFTVENDGEQDVDAYTVALINIMNYFTFKDDLEVTVSCSSNINGGKCEGFAEDYENKVYKEKYPATNTELFSLGIKENETHTFTLTVDYLYQDFDQSDDMGKTLKGKVQIYDPKDTIEVSGEVTGYAEGDYAEIHSDVQTSEIVDGVYKFVGIPADNHTVYIKNRNTGSEKSTTLEIKKGTTESTTNGVITFTDTSKIANVVIDATNANLSTTINKVSDGKTLLKETIMSDARITKNNGTPSFDSIADYKVTGDASSGEIGMYSAEDDYGTSWYFRGAQSYNYVNFAGFTWRIVRINGDGSIRLILQDSFDTLDGCDDSNSDIKFCGVTPFSTLGSQSADDYGNIGYMSGTYLDKSAENRFDYDIQNKNLNDSDVKKFVDAFYEKYIISYQKYLADTLFCGDKLPYSIFIYDDEFVNYPYVDTINYYLQNGSRSATLKCVDVETAEYTEEQKSYSRYTSILDMSTTTNKGVLVNNDLKYPIALLSADEAIMAGNVFGGITSGNYLYNSLTLSGWWLMGAASYGEFNYLYLFAYTLTDIWPIHAYGIRPVINLRSDVLINSGNGTVDRPYTVKLPI